jgi:hypothetical protein
MADLFCQLHCFTDGSVRWQVIHEAELVSSQPEKVADGGGQRFQETVRALLKHPIQPISPAQDPVGKLAQEGSLLGCETLRSRQRSD